ncbi:alanine racemase [Legionella sp. CNM-4043-24]|uniref:alanine racemase n=1 Tax=Legionella sp. CNM-4043-24 TaxID=3421646 RepID=UPI00403AD138
MSRPTGVHIDAAALRHNLNQVQRHAPGRRIIAMVKANAYGCGIGHVVPVIEDQVHAFGVACLEEAMAIRKLGVSRDCVLFQGVFSAAELPIAAELGCYCVLHQAHQLRWLLENPLPRTIRVWVKVNTGMNRLGFLPDDVYDVLSALRACPWVDDEIGLMTHFASADERDNPSNQQQLQNFQDLRLPSVPLIKSLANSAAIMALPESLADVVRPGIMLYGVSPFADQTGVQNGLVPVMRFFSAVSAIHHYTAGERLGYGGTWTLTRPSVIAVVAAGYGDGYPRHIATGTPVAINGSLAPIVGRVSMDMMTVDVTDCPGVCLGDRVELWGETIPVETIARSAGTIAYELICQFSPRAS